MGPNESYPEMIAISRGHLRLVWEQAQSILPLADEDARLVEVMREHPEYEQLWERLDELSDEEIEQDGTNPILHVTLHHIVENQLAEGKPSETRRALAMMMRRGLPHHEAVHRIAGVMAEMMFEVLKNQRPFNERDYVGRLRRLVRKL